MHTITFPVYVIVSRKRYKTEQVLQKIDLSDNRYFEEVDNDYEVNNIQLDREVDSEAYNIYGNIKRTYIYNITLYQPRTDNKCCRGQCVNC